MMLIDLGHGLTAKVDERDADLASHRWYALKPHAHLLYASCSAGPFRKQTMHRVIAVRMGLDVGGKHVDHINGDPLDNRRANLRAVSPSVNGRNTDSLSTQNTSGFRGVSFHRRTQKFRAYIRTNYRTRHLGLFRTAEEANHARLSAEAEEWGIEPRRAEAHAA